MDRVWLLMAAEAYGKTIKLFYETFANKKQKVPEVKAHVNAQLDCFASYWCKDMRL